MEATTCAREVATFKAAVMIGGEGDGRTLLPRMCQKVLAAYVYMNFKSLILGLGRLLI